MTEDFNTRLKLFIDSKRRQYPSHPIFHLKKIEQLANIKLNCEISKDEIKKSGIKIEGDIIKDSNGEIIINISPLKNENELIVIKQYYDVYKNDHESIIKAYFLNEFKRELLSKVTTCEEEPKNEEEEEEEDCEIICIECTIKEEIGKMKEELKQEFINYLWNNKFWIFGGLVIAKLLL